MLIVQIEADSYLGSLFLGRVHSGTLSVGDTLISLNAEGQVVGEGKVKKIFAREGLQRVEKMTAAAGEIVGIAGIKVLGGGVNCTLVHPDGWGTSGPQPLPTTPIDPPTISINVFPNDSPLAGKEGTKLTSQVIKDRIFEEAETNVALRVLPGPSSDSLELRGRGVLHLGVLLEVLRREGFELCVGPPKAVLIPDPNSAGTKPTFLEPVEECTVLVKEEYAGGVVEKLTKRRGELRSYDSGDPEEGWVRIVMDIPARGLIGYMAGEFKNDVHGQGYVTSEPRILNLLAVTFSRTINHIFKGYEPYGGSIDTGRNGALISMTTGESSAYAMAPLQARGTLFITPHTQGINQHLDRLICVCLLVCSLSRYDHWRIFEVE
jgi:GTP-binding protein TypA/BipA